MSISNKDHSDSDLRNSLPAAAAALSAEDRAGLVNALKNNLQNLAVEHSDILKRLSPQVRKRIDALRKLQGQPAALKALLSEEKAVLKAGYEKLHESLHTKSERDALKALFMNEMVVLEAKYEKLHDSLYTKYEIVNGVVEVEGDNMGTGDEKGVPNFWLNAMKAFEIYEDEMNISPQNEEALKFLKDIKCCRVDHPKGFKLDFFFDTNPFFKNSVLTKTCHNTINKDMVKNDRY
ncbi:nucleosome assembly protein 1;4-like [Solanum dulcamara]|uniref:nucleosome assembly protein 1;4-like n=1 Tax=Solanum dulcamara TaxID=45834 RepID=UPI00248652AD|nr:nucleosome assembly protein 1;4-like [Solanum dulcamara]